MSARESALDKIRKLLAVARDGRGNEHEAETALRMAEAMMRRHGLEEAELATPSASELDLGEGLADPDGGRVRGWMYKEVARWSGLLAVGVAKFADCVVDVVGTPEGVKLRFRGHRPDVALGAWLHAYLVAAMDREAAASGFSGQRELRSFRTACAAKLQARLWTLRAERDVAYRDAGATGGRALMIVDRKAAAIAEAFGGQKLKRERYSADARAHATGWLAGGRVAIPSGRPVDGPTAAARVGVRAG